MRKNEQLQNLKKLLSQITLEILKYCVMINYSDSMILNLMQMFTNLFGAIHFLLDMDTKDL